jgi:hypothetical protein
MTIRQARYLSLAIPREPVDARDDKGIAWPEEIEQDL